MVRSGLANGIECSCGKRMMGWDVEVRRTPESPLGWPVVIDGKRYACRHMGGSLSDRDGEHALTSVFGDPPNIQYCCLCNSQSFGDELVEVKETP